MTKNYYCFRKKYRLQKFLYMVICSIFRMSAIEEARCSAGTRLRLRTSLAGPIVADLAPPHLLGRYMSLYGLTFMAGVALGPAVGGALLATSPDAVWRGGALAAALTGAGLLRLGDRIPDPISQVRRTPPQPVGMSDMDAICHSQIDSAEM
jgi:MFS family permease